MAGSRLEVARSLGSRSPSRAEAIIGRLVARAPAVVPRPVADTRNDQEERGYAHDPPQAFLPVLSRCPGHLPGGTGPRRPRVRPTASRPAALAAFRPVLLGPRPPATARTARPTAQVATLARRYWAPLGPRSGAGLGGDHPGRHRRSGHQPRRSMLSSRRSSTPTTMPRPMPIVPPAAGRTSWSSPPIALTR